MNVYTPLLIGILVAFALTFVGTTLFYLRAWNERRSDREYLYFALTTLCVGVLLAMYAMGYGAALGFEPVSREIMARLVVVPSKLAVAFLLHFALRYAQVRRVRAIMGSVYALAALYSWLGLSGGYWRETTRFVETTVLGFSLHRWEATPTAAAAPFYLLAAASALAVLLLMARQWRRDRRGWGAFAGSALLALVACNEIALRFDWYPTVPLLPIGFLLFSYGVSLTLLQRYGTAAAELERHTEELQQRSFQLAESYRELKLTQQRLVRSQQLAVVGELAAVIAHEVRNPLAIVNNAVASLRKRHTTLDDRRTLLEIINEEMGRLDKLVGRLLNYARPVLPRREHIPLRDLITRTLALIEDRPGVDAQLEFEDGVSDVQGDSDLLRQVFENIVNNAAQAMRDKGTLHVSVSRAEHRGEPAVAIDFVDDGEGMSAETSAQARAPFFTTRPTGTGLGLPIVERIVAAHGGALEIDSTLGSGTKVRVLLPERFKTRLKGADPRERRDSLMP